MSAKKADYRRAKVRPERVEAQNTFANDGSFLEMFKKKMEAEKLKKEEEEAAVEAALACGDDPTEQGVAGETGSKQLADPGKSFLPCVGKRRGGKVLPTGMVKKARKESEEGQKNDAWSQYMAEVKRYRERSCEDEGKTRPLVK